MECSVVESWFTWYMHFIQHSQWPFCGEALKSLSLGGKGIKVYLAYLPKSSATTCHPACGASSFKNSWLRVWPTPSS